MSKPVVLVIGATGNVGFATIQALSAKYSSHVEIQAGSRDPSKAEKLKSIPGVSVVKAEMGSEELENTLKGVDALFIIAPGVKNRGQLIIETAQTAKKAGVKYLLAMSAPDTAHKETYFVAELLEMETAIKSLGIPCTFICLPLFYENFFGFKDTIKGAGAIYSPIDPTKPFDQVAVSDIGNAAAAILSDPASHVSKSYIIVSCRQTYNDVVTDFGEVLGKSVTYNRVPYEDAKKAFMGKGLPEWQADGLLEQFKLIDQGESAQYPLGDYQKITGEEPTSFRSWVEKSKEAFL